MVSKKTKTAIAILLTGTLVACSGSNDNDSGGTGTETGNGTETGTGTDIVNNPGTFTQLGLVGISDYSNEQKIEVYGSFDSFPRTIDADGLQSFFDKDIDTCDVSVTDLTELPDSPSLTDEVGVLTSISAGDVITVSSPAGSFAEMSKQTSGEYIYYRNDSLAGQAPSGLVLDIPGDAFPAFSNIQMPDIQPIALTSHVGSALIEPDSVFTWEAGSNSNAYVTLSMNQIDSSETLTSVVCYVTDDGKFTFPESTKAELGSDFSIYGAGISRKVTTFHPQGSAMLVVTRESGY